MELHKVWAKSIKIEPYQFHIKLQIMAQDRSIISDGIVIGKIQIIRGQKVMLDEDLAELYEVQTKRLNEQVKRNQERFPFDFMFQLTKKEFNDLKSQYATSRWGGRRIQPYAFTEHGVLMLSSVLKSKKAVQVNIQIMRIFTKMRELLLSQKDLILKVEKIETKLEGQNHEIRLLFEYIKKLMQQNQNQENQKLRNKIGFIKD